MRIVVGPLGNASAGNTNSPRASPPSGPSKRTASSPQPSPDFGCRQHFATARAMPFASNTTVTFPFTFEQ